MAVKKRRKKGEITKLKEELWDLCRNIIRTRYGNKCYTCGKTRLKGSNWQTGHYITSAICSMEVRYDLENLRPQCYRCNINLSGNWVAFDRNIKEEMGDVFVDELKALNEKTLQDEKKKKGKKWGAYVKMWLIDKIKEYKQISPYSSTTIDI